MRKNRILVCIIALISAVSILSGCGADKKPKKSVPVSRPTESSAATSDTASPSSASAETYPALDAYGLDGREVKLSDEAYRDFIGTVDSIKTEYPYSEYFFIDEALEAYNAVADEKSGTADRIITDGKADENKLYTAVIRNNKTLTDKEKSGKYSDLSDSEIKRILHTVTEQINDMLALGSDIDTDYLNYKLDSLTLFGHTGFGTAGVDLDRPMMWVHMKTIENLQKSNPDTDVFDRVIRHEANHLIQVVYSDDGKVVNQLGFCRKLDGVKVNSLYWNWLLEGSAEKLTLDPVHGKHLYYEANVDMIESMELAASAREGVGLTCIEQATLQTDPEKLFACFGADTADKKKEIIMMMIGADTIFENSNSFTDYYKEQTGSLNVSKLDAMGEEFRRTIAQTLTKVFYSGLAERASKNSLGVLDMFALIQAFEEEMNRWVDSDNTLRAEDNKDFLAVYKQIQDAFFDATAASSDIEASKLHGAFCAFSDMICASAKGKKEDTFDYTADIGFLTEEQNRFITYTVKNRINHIYLNFNR